MNAVNACKIGHKSKIWLSGSVLFALLTASIPTHADGYIQTNLVASTDAYGASIVDPTLINAWGIAIRPTGFGGHFWVESNGGGTSNQFIGDVGGTPLYLDDLTAGDSAGSNDRRDDTYPWHLHTRFGGTLARNGLPPQVTGDHRCSQPDARIIALG